MCPGWTLCVLAEREGLPRSFNKNNRISDLMLARDVGVHQFRVPKSSRFRFPHCSIFANDDSRSFQ
jgi:hypothetical protein